MTTDMQTPAAAPTPGRTAKAASQLLALLLLALVVGAWNRGAAEPVVTDYVEDSATSPNWAFVTDRAPLIAAFVTSPDGAALVDEVYASMGTEAADEFRAGACAAASRSVFLPPWTGQVGEACAFLENTTASRDEDAAYLALLMTGRLRDHCVKARLARPFDQTSLGTQFDWSRADVARLERVVSEQAAAGCPATS